MDNIIQAISDHEYDSAIGYIIDLMETNDIGADAYMLYYQMIMAIRILMPIDP